MENWIAFITWVNSNSGFITAISTMAYIIFTAIIVLQTRAGNRGWLFPSLAKVPGERSDLLCLKIENPTNTPVKNAKVTLCDKWLAQYDSIKDPGAQKNREDLKQINSGTFTVMPSQALYYVVCIIPGDYYQNLTNLPLKVTIKYNRLRGGRKENYKFDLKGMGTQLAQASEYVRMERIRLEKLNKIIEKLEEGNRARRPQAAINPLPRQIKLKG